MHNNFIYVWSHIEHENGEIEQSEENKPMQQEIQYTRNYYGIIERKHQIRIQLFDAARLSHQQVNGGMVTPPLVQPLLVAAMTRCGSVWHSNIARCLLSSIHPSIPLYKPLPHALSLALDLP